MFRILQRYNLLMQVTIEIPEFVAHRAEAAGLDVPTYLQRLIEKEALLERKVMPDSCVLILAR